HCRYPNPAAHSVITVTSAASRPFLATIKKGHGGAQLTGQGEGGCPDRRGGPGQVEPGTPSGQRQASHDGAIRAEYRAGCADDAGPGLLAVEGRAGLAHPAEFAA